MRIFLTGATGVVGRRVVPLLVARGHSVTAIGRSDTKREALRRAGADAVDVDLFDGAGLRAVLPGHDAILNLATHMPTSTFKMLLPWSWGENDRVRTLGSATLADAALAVGVPRFVQESFAPVYTANGDAWIDERRPLKPARYNRSIVDAERSATRFTAAGGTGIVLRFAAFYGPDAFHIRDMLDTMRKGWTPIPGPPDAFLSSIAHDDAASAAVAALEIPAGVYNVSDDEPVTRAEWAHQLAGDFGMADPKPLPWFLVRLMGSTGELLSRSLRVSNRHLRSVSAWAPRYPSVREGFRALASEMSRSASAMRSA